MPIDRENDTLVSAIARRLREDIEMAIKPQKVKPSELGLTVHPKMSKYRGVTVPFVRGVRASWWGFIRVRWSHRKSLQKIKKEYLEVIE